MQWFSTYLFPEDPEGACDDDEGGHDDIDE